MERPFEPSFIIKAFSQVLPYLRVTFAIMLCAIFFGIALGLLLAKAKMGKRKWSKIAAEIYIAAMRCTPSIVMLFIMFYGLPALMLAVFKVNINGWPKFIFVVSAMTLLFAAQAAEIMRGAYEAVDAGQFEAAVTTGLTPFQAFRRIMLPQAFVVALPNFGNSFIGLLKEGSLAYTIGVIDVMGQGNLFISRHYGAYALETYIALAVIYWTLTIIIEQSFKKIEKEFSRGRKVKC